jgi:hypothetical protein
MFNNQREQMCKRRSQNDPGLGRTWSFVFPSGIPAMTITYFTSRKERKVSLRCCDERLVY